MNKYLPLIIVTVFALSLMSLHAKAAENTFQISANVIDSSTSTPATTTPPVIIATSTLNSESSSSGSQVLMINNLIVDTAQNSTLITFDTNQQTQAKVFWGITKDNEIGSISGLFYSYDHSIKISNLHSDTKYFYRIEVVNIQGIRIATEGTFQTQKDYNFTSVANVTHFQAIPQEDSIALSWNIPDYRDINSVRIVRSDRFFPKDIDDGEMVFEGNSEKYNDTSVIKNKLYYYAIFAKDSKGNYSSGVLAQAEIKFGQSTTTSSSTDPFIGIKIIENVDSIIKDLLFSDFDFIQDNKKIENIDSIITVDSSKNLTLLLEYKKVPEILKTIAITLTDPDDSTKVFTFLLRVNDKKTLYEATLAPLGKKGKYKVNVIVLDYKNQGLKKLQGTLNILIWKKNQELFKNCGIFDEISKCTELSIKNKIIVYIILLILIMIAVLGFVLKRRENKK